MSDMIEDDPSDTPRTDAAAFVAGNFSGKHDVVTVDFAEQLERELNAAKAALSGRTVSCSNCNELVREKANLKFLCDSQQQTIDYLTNLCQKLE